jgi:hypothetical protein
MVSLEEEMKQKDKEAAVLKANHKYEMLLNIELERLEKCKRTYEHFHNFEVAVMKDRQNRILQKKLELKVQKNLPKLDVADLQQGCQWRKSQPQMHSKEKCLSKNNQTNRACIQEPAGRISDKTNVTKSLAQPKGNSSHTVIPASNEQNQRSRRAHYANEMQYANLQPRSQGANLSVTRVANKPNSERSNFHENALATNTPSADNVVRLPVLQTVSPSVKSPATTNCSSASPIKRHTHFPENLTETHVIQSRDARTTVSRKKKKSHRNANSHLSSFDQYRLRLQESEQRTWKPKHHFPRSISAMEYNLRRTTDDTLTAVRRARSADVQ